MAIAYREDVDGLRAVAVLGVVAYHLSPTLAPGGFVGVDVFFVISGYLITAIIAREAAQGRFSFLSFWARRARRILPALTVMVAASFVAGAFLLPPGQFRDFTISAVAALLFAANFHFKDQAGYFDAPAESHPLLHTWSLAVEEQFYLVWPLIIVLALRAPGWARAAILGALILGSLIAAEAMMADAPISVFYLLPFRLWELALGGALALALARPEGARLAAGLAPAAAQALSLTGLALVLGSIAALDQSTPFPGLSAAPACLGTALLIFSGAAARAPIGARLLGTAPMVAVGLASYSLYLWHWPVLVYHRLLNHGRPPEGWLEIAALLALSGLLAALSLRYVERPFRSEAARRFGDGRALLVAGAGVGAAALIALQAHLSGGWAWRAPAKVAHIEAAAVPSLRYRPCNLAIGSAPMTERIAACSFGAPRRGESFDMVLLGDSHVENVADMIVGYAERRGLSALVLYRSACAPIVTIG
ncbi:MAG: acyltransferase family protein, partial [Pseudomonadota bacterium]